MVNQSSRLWHSLARKNISPGKPTGSMAERAEDLGVDVFLRRAFSDLSRANGRSLSGFIVAKICRSNP
jgi:hypothetical protein